MANRNVFMEDAEGSTTASRDLVSSESVGRAVPEHPLLARLTEEDKQTIRAQYQKYPHLWDDFSNVIEFLDLLEKDPGAYRTLYRTLEKIHKVINYNPQDEINVGRFAIAIGFVDQCVDFQRRIMREMKKDYLTEIPLPEDIVPRSWETACLYRVRNCFQNFSATGMEFRGRLADTGVLQDMLEDVKHIKHLTADALENNNICALSMGTIYNCCLNPVVVPVLRKMNTVDHLTPFLDKADKSLPRATALMTLAYLVEPHQMDVLELNPDSLQYYLDVILTRSRDIPSVTWSIAEVLSGLALLAKNDFNKQLIVAKGSMKTLMAILQCPTQSEEENEAALRFIGELAVDRPNAQVFQRDRDLVKNMERLRDSENQKIRENAASVLSLMRKHTADANHIPSSKLLTEFLEDSKNALTILDIGEVGYVLERLRLLGRENNSAAATTRVSASDLICVLGDMSKDGGYRREIFARDGLGLLTERMKTGSTEEKQQAMSAVLAFAPHRECSMIMQSHQALKATLRELQNSEDTSISQAAGNLLQTLAISISA